MPIKNYTTKIDQFTTVGEIQGALARNGARKVMIDYEENGSPIAIMFGICTPDMGQQAYYLPANVDGVLAVFKKQKLKPDPEQASRTAWRNIRDWVLAQMAFMEAGNAQIDEVFLPYLTDGSNKTLYQAYKARQLCIGDGVQK